MGAPAGVAGIVAVGVGGGALRARRCAHRHGTRPFAADVDFLKHHGKAGARGRGAAVVPQVKEHIANGIAAADETERTRGVPADDGALFGHGVWLMRGVGLGGRGLPYIGERTIKNVASCAYW